MEQQHLEQLFQLEKKLYIKLVQTLSLTQELSDGVERQDQHAVQLLLSQRQMPVLELQEIHSLIQLKRVDLDADDAQDYDRLLQGEQAQSPVEQPLVEQLAVNHRLLSRLIELDQTVNRRLCGDNSCYAAP